MGVALGCERQVVFFPGEKALGFIGEKIGIILPADPHNRIGAQIGLLNLVAGIAFVIGCSSR